ncbi:hypothetical protein ACNHUS_34790 [Actinomycetes bacterium M1A6_2h]
MSRKATALLLAAGSVVAVAVAAITVWLIPTSTDAPSPGGTDAGIAINPVGTEPADVAVTVMSGVFSWQPAVQDSSWDALHTQQEYLSGAMAEAAARPPSPAPKPLSEWAAWARSGDTITAVVRLDGGPTVDGDDASVPVTITQTVQHTDGDTTPYATSTATVTLEKVSDGWKVVNYRLIDTVQ